jgi:4,5:9,10-diseco-3-hydroxy-5,9,17-trioxoandrosta-1(10),2-diene-4-oate hydrolase
MTTMQLTDEATGHFIDAGGLRTHYNELGSGPAVICLHGGGPGASGFSNFKQNVEALSANYRTILLDQPGFGQTAIPPAGLTSADHLKGFLDAIGEKKASLIGNSMGAGTSLRFAFKYPEMVDKMILMGPGAVGPTFNSTAPSVGNNAIQEFYLGEGPTKEKLAKLLRLIVYRPEQFLRDDLLDERLKAALRPEVVAWRRGQIERQQSMPTPATVSLDMMVDCSKIKAPTLVLWGMEDRFNPVEVGVQLCKLIPGSQLHVFAEVGHWVQVEKAEEFNRLALDFLAH